MSNFVFIYSAKSDVLSNVPGAIKKIVGGKSACGLCNITNGPIREKKDWKEFFRSLARAELYHSDEIPGDVQVFLEKEKVEIPVVLTRDRDSYSVQLSKNQLDACEGSVACLEKQLK